MPGAHGPDPWLAYNFRLSIDSINVAAFRDVKGLEVTAEVVEYREGTDGYTPRKLSGLNKYSNVTLSRGVTNDHSLYDWIKQVIDGKNRDKTVRKSMSIMLLNEKGDTVLTWNFTDCWPTKSTMPSFDATKSEVAIETLEIACEGWVEA